MSDPRLCTDRYHYQLKPRTRMTVAAFKGAFETWAGGDRAAMQIAEGLNARYSIPVRRALMPEISNQTMVIAIRAIAAEIRALRETVMSGEAQPGEHQLLEDRLQAAEDFERAYDLAAWTVLNLPPYDELVGD